MVMVMAIVMSMVMVILMSMVMVVVTMTMTTMMAMRLVMMAVMIRHKSVKTQLTHYFSSQATASGNTDHGQRWPTVFRARATTH